jgi:serine/threonine protein kinase
MVLYYVKDGSLRNYLDNFYNKLSWYDKIHSLYKIVFGLRHIHNNEIIHRDLHVGNILFNHNIRFNHDYVYITDMGLCKPVDYNSSENTKIKVYPI